MKKLLVLVMVLAMASLASATLSISVNGQVPSGDITLNPSDHVILDITGDGQTPSPQTGVWLIVQGPGTITGGALVGTPPVAGSLSEYVTDVNPSARWTVVYPWLTGLGYANLNGIGEILFADGSIPPASLNGKLVDGIDFHCEALGDVLISLVNIYDDGEGTVVITPYDTQIIHQVPEPVTVALLGLGGLFLRRRIA